MKKPKLVIISETIRRDLNQPLQYFKEFEVIHFYGRASYGDMKQQDFDQTRSVQIKKVRSLYRLLKEEQPDIIQVPEPAANQFSFKAGLMCLAYWRAFHPVMVMPNFENRPLEKKFAQPKLRMVEWLTRRLALSCSLMIVLNQGAKDNLIKLGVDRKKIVNLMWGSWGINLDEFHPLDKKKTDQILFVGRVSIAKGIKDLLTAFKQVKQEVPGAELVIAGPKGDASGLVESSEAKFLGPLKHSDVPGYLARAAVVAMPSKTSREWEEQVGMVGLQALACGTPVVTTKSGAIPEYFKEDQGVVLIEEGDSEELAKGLIKILSDANYRHQQERAAVSFIKENYEVKEQIAKIEQALKKLL